MSRHQKRSSSSPSSKKYMYFLERKPTRNPNVSPSHVLNPTPYRKMAITPKNNDPKEPKLCDFSYISIYDKPSHTLLGAQNGKKGVFIAFLLLAVPISGS